VSEPNKLCKYADGQKKKFMVNHRSNFLTTSSVTIISFAPISSISFTYFFKDSFIFKSFSKFNIRRIKWFLNLKEKLTTLIELWERNEEIVDEIYRASQICKRDYVINAWDFLWHHAYLYIYESYDLRATLAIGYNDGSQILYGRGIILAINKIF